LSNTVVTTGIQVWLRKLGGADVKVNELGPITKVGTGGTHICYLCLCTSTLESCLWISSFVAEVLQMA
jgi:hypothetical protein